jgi:hypothetical protein
MYEKVKLLIKSSENSDDWEDIAYDLCGSYNNERELSHSRFGLIKELKAKGITLFSVEGYGGEDEGSDYWGIFKIEWNGKEEFVKLSGWYASYSGSEIDIWGWEPVKKVPVQRYEWVSVKDDE